MYLHLLYHAHFNTLRFGSCKQCVEHFRKKISKDNNATNNYCDNGFRELYLCSISSENMYLTKMLKFLESSTKHKMK